MTAVRFSGGPVRTLAAAAPVASELVVQDGRIVARTTQSPVEVDLRGRCVLPAFSDAHVHFPTWSAAQRQIRLEGTATIEEALDRVATAAQAMRGSPPTGWLRGLGWRADDWHPATEPHRSMLDRAAPGVPIALMSRDYHSLWVSSAGLALARGPLLVPGGVVETDADGAPTGVLREMSAWTFRDRWAAPSADEYLDAMRDGVRLANARGVTAIHDKDGWLGALELFRRLEAEDGLTLRVWQSQPWERLDSGLPEPSAPGSLVRVGYLKAFMDGTLGSRTARRLDGSGVEILSREAFEEIVRRAAAAGLPVAVHAIGDQANRDALDALEAARAAWEPLGLRQRIEHAQLLHPDDVGRFAALGVTASVQFSHAPSDRDLADAFWGADTANAYPYGALAAAGTRLVNGSDAPVEELDPLLGLRAGVLRTTDGRPAWHPEHAVAAETALRASTVEPAWLAREEHIRGRLVPGMAADLVVLDRDPLAVAPEQLGSLRVVATMLAGGWVHGADTMHE
jgi:predicted amidohydrolase YtcJ